MRVYIGIPLTYNIVRAEWRCRLDRPAKDPLLDVNLTEPLRKVQGGYTDNQDHICVFIPKTQLRKKGRPMINKTANNSLYN